MWKDGPRNFSAVWRIPARTGCETLRVDLCGLFLVLVVRRGAIRLSHGSTEVWLSAGQAAALSVAEFHAEIPELPDGESVFDLHLFSRMPAARKLGKESVLAQLLSKQGRDSAGIFPYANAGQLRHEALAGGEPVNGVVTLLSRLYCCGLQSTVRFIASGQGRGVGGKVKRHSPEPLLAHLPKPVLELAW